MDFVKRKSPLPGLSVVIKTAQLCLLIMRFDPAIPSIVRESEYHSERLTTTNDAQLACVDTFKFGHWIIVIPFNGVRSFPFSPFAK